MEMCYDGTLVMPANYAVVSEDEITYVDGGGTLKVRFNDGMAMYVIAGLGGAATATAITAALDALGLAIASAIEVGTAGAGTLAVGAFIIAWGGIAAKVGGLVATYGISQLKGKEFKIASGWWCPDFTLDI